MIFIIFVVVLINSGIRTMDEIWCYSFSKRIAEGYVPYKDYNVILTPLFFFIGAIFSNSLVLFRIYGALISSAVVFLTFYICKKNKVDTQLSVIITLSNCILILIIADANYSTMLLLGLMMLFLIANRFFEKKDNMSSLLFGFSLSIVLLIKQNVPAILVVVFTVMLLLLLLSRVITYKTFIYYMIGGIIPITIFIFYAVINGFLVDFIDYTILGMYSFVGNYRIQDGLNISFS